MKPPILQNKRKKNCCKLVFWVFPEVLHEFWVAILLWSYSCRQLQKKVKQRFRSKKSYKARDALIEKKGNKDMGSENFISMRFRYISKLFRGAKEQQSWWCLDQISARTKFIVIILQKRCMGTRFWQVNAFSNYFVTVKVGRNHRFNVGMQEI